MVVECEACRSKFNLDDAKIPSGGLKVRCSKCSHIFMIKKEVQKANAFTGRPAPPPKQQPQANNSDFDFSVFTTKNEALPKGTPAAPKPSLFEQPKKNETIEKRVSPTAVTQPPPKQESESSPQPMSDSVHRETPKRKDSFDFGGQADFGAYSFSSPHQEKEKQKNEIIVEDQGNPQGKNLGRQWKPGQEIATILEERGLTDEYVVQKVHEVCEATRNVEGHEKPDWPIRVIGIDMLCKIKGLYKSEKKDDLSNKQFQIVTGINVKDVG